MLSFDFSGVKVRQVLEAAWSSNQVWDKLSPEVSALAFYSMHEVLGEDPDNLEVKAAFQKYLQSEGLRFFYYMFMITARELRHLKGYGNMSAAAKKHIKPFRENSYGPEHYIGSDQPFLDLHLVTWMEYVVEAYYKVNWSQSFGGKKWGVIAELLQKFVRQEINLEILLDQGFTLQHNTSSIFNKPYLYSNYSYSMQKILDKQASSSVIGCAHWTEYNNVTLLCGRKLSFYKDLVEGKKVKTAAKPVNKGPNKSPKPSYYENYTHNHGSELKSWLNGLTKREKVVIATPFKNIAVHTQRSALIADMKEGQGNG